MKILSDYNNDDLEIFLRESNAIEREYSNQALEDSLKAWKFIINFDSLDLSRLLEIHRILMLSLNNRIAGKLRDVNVRVGNKICPDYSIISGLLSEWFQKHSNAKTEEEIKTAHISFEKIHPFEDGNGRAGRIIMQWQRLKSELPILIIREGEEQMSYYEWFKNI